MFYRRQRGKSIYSNRRKTQRFSEVLGRLDTPQSIPIFLLMEKLETKILAATFSVFCLCLLYSQEAKAGGGIFPRGHKQCFEKAATQPSSKCNYGREGQLDSWVPLIRSSSSKIVPSTAIPYSFHRKFTFAKMGAKEFQIRTGLSPPAFLAL